ncbi:MAG: epoxyqueuosine reductase QueH [Lachnospiraceae bacterium]|nr:epoxyqueuosine reductase QueH [Lachnospiraceae bacterium]
MTEDAPVNYPNRNYQKELDKIILQMTQRKKLLLHSCCAPCSSYCLEYLSQYFDVTVFYYNPNITEENEYQKRAAEQQRLIRAMNERQHTTISYAEGVYEPEEYLAMVRGLEQEPEGAGRCERCFRLRLTKTAEYASDNGFDYFTTTLTISPLKNAHLLNALGEEIGKKTGIAFLPSDFKKKEGYKRSIELSKEYDLYRQNYCGCIFSKREETGE